ncbi:MAG: hypothetical protein GXO40_01480, partial [Epsilonproteobacteria bacterium]|nr:hypothetical protein [Campylobacterota bacterium]
MKYTRILRLAQDDVTQEDLEKLRFENSKTGLVICFVSAYLDFEKIMKKIKEFFGDTVVIGTLTAGELCSVNLDQPEKSLYKPVSEDYPDIVLQSFSDEMIQSAQVLTIPLPNAKDKVQAIKEHIDKLHITTKIHYQDTIAYTLVDGLSKKEHFFIEAVYQSGKFPCQLIGGSSGGKLDFSQTYLFNNQEVVTDVALVTLIKMRENIKFGILKSQNFVKLDTSFEVFECDDEERYIQSIIDRKTNKTMNFIDYLLQIFNCDKESLEEKLANFAFGIVINDEPFIRSIAKIDFENNKVYFYCDVKFGDIMYLFKTTDFVEQTQKDFEKFLQNKPSKPFGGILNDCILRRIFNAQKLDKLHCFDGIELAGFSTFGELLGVNINQTLTAIFFFEVAQGESFSDEYVDNFINNYANFRLFFNERVLNALKSKEIQKLNKKLEEKLKQQTNILMQQKQHIELIHQHTKDSIRYASFIQSALIPKEETLDKFFDDKFVIWKPKDIVGGDIWLFSELRHQDECLLFVIDCTG